ALGPGVEAGIGRRRGRSRAGRCCLRGRGWSSLGRSSGTSFRTPVRIVPLYGRVVKMFAELYQPRLIDLGFLIDQHGTQPIEGKFAMCSRRVASCAETSMRKPCDQSWTPNSGASVISPG